MKLVIDASVACKWLFPEVGSDKAERLLVAGVSLIAPELIIAEVTNAAWKKAMAGDIAKQRAIDAAQHLAGMIDEFLPLAELAARATAIALELNHPVYDCYYLALAEAGPARLVTDDRRLIAAANKQPWSRAIVALDAAARLKLS